MTGSALSRKGRHEQHQASQGCLESPRFRFSGAGDTRFLPVNDRGRDTIGRRAGVLLACRSWQISFPLKLDDYIIVASTLAIIF